MDTITLSVRVGDEEDEAIIDGGSLEVLLSILLSRVGS